MNFFTFCPRVARVKLLRTWHIALSPRLEDRKIDNKIAESAQKTKVFWGLFSVYVTVAIGVGVVLQLSGMFERQELQTINRRFEARQWLVWSKESLKRLNPAVLWDYHEKHEQPRAWYAWDYTLSWLIENNHPRVCNKVVIFNHQVQDEPPKAATEQYPWMKPLQNYPIRRKTVAEIVEFLAKAGASAIVLDSDFPQHSVEEVDDFALAKAIHEAATGEYGKPVPVFMVRAVNEKSTGQIVVLEEPTTPEGIIEDLEKLEPKTDVLNKYTGENMPFPDHDQVVRGMYIHMPGVGNTTYTAVVLKVLQELKLPIPAGLPVYPDSMDIDFAAPPQSDLYPVRPISYLLDPEQRERMLKKNSASGDVTVDNAIVFIGDGVTDVYSTPFTNEGLNQMSGTEILANALDTISRHSWPRRLTNNQSLIYLWLNSVVGGMVWVFWKHYQLTLESGNKNLSLWRLRGSIYRLTTDTFVFCNMLTSSLLLVCIIFAYTGLIVPVFVPSIALGLGTLAAIVWERERAREQAFLEQLESQQENHELELEKFEADLAKQEVEAENREMYQDRKRRHEFVRRINHDLNAPVSVLNWTISELQMMDLENLQAKEKISRLVKASDKLCELIDQLVQSYNYEITPGISNNEAAICDLTQVLDDCVDSQQPLAQKFEATLEWSKPEKILWVKANSLELSRVIDNIIRNAIKHNPKKTSVFITIDTTGSFHKILISDSGKGIPSEHIGHIFEPGYRVNPDKKDGHGLGLDIAKTLVEGMGGEISVTSTLGMGTTFQLRLPVCPEAKAMHHDFVFEIMKATLTDSPALHAFRKNLEIANEGTGELK